MNEKDFEQAKQLLENFSKISQDTQDKLLNGVKCLAFLYDLADSHDDNDDKISSLSQFEV